MTVVYACYEKSYGLPLYYICSGTFVGTYIDCCRPHIAAADIDRIASTGGFVEIHGSRNGNSLADYVAPVLISCDNFDRTIIIRIRSAPRDRSCEREEHGDYQN